MASDLVSVLLQLSQIDEDVHAGQAAGMDHAHEDIADIGTVLGLVEEAILAVEDGEFQGALDDIVVEGRAGGAQEEGRVLSASMP